VAAILNYFFDGAYRFPSLNWKQKFFLCHYVNVLPPDRWQKRAFQFLGCEHGRGWIRRPYTFKAPSTSTLCRMLLRASREDACDLLFALTLTGARLAIFGGQSARVVRGGDLLWDTFPPKAADLTCAGNGELCRAAMRKRSPW
jgi:hypothetical protein